MSSTVSHEAAQIERIEIDEPRSVARWTKELSVTEAQLRDAVGKVGDIASDVEFHLKGSRSSTNEDVAGAA